MTRLRHALVGFVLVPLWLGGVGVHLGSSDAASAATTPEAAVFHVYDLAARNYIRAFASSTAGVSQAQRAAARVSQAQPRITGSLSAKSGLGDTATTTVRIHGNSASSPATSYLYRLEDAATGEYLKTGISQNPFSRYSQTFMRGKRMRILQEGSRREMLNLERFIVERDPGLLNREPWAGRYANDVPGGG